MLAEEAIATLPTVRTKVVETPCGEYTGLELPPVSSVAVVSVVRAGDSLQEAVRRVMPGMAVGKILIQRDESSPEKKAKLIYVKLPPDIKERVVLLTDPMLATGGSAEQAIRVLVSNGVPEENIVFANVVSCPEGIRHLAESHPRVRIVTAAIDDGLNEHKYIVPGLGDYGDRYFGTEA